MKLTKRHINQLFTNDLSDGSWIYQLVDIKKEKLLFYSFAETTFVQETNKFADWRFFKPVNIINTYWGKRGWEDSKLYVE